MHIGIDIGSFKTVMYTTANKGSVITDKYGSREMPTVLELSRPTRGFGKDVTSDSPANIALRHRNFFSNLKNPDSRRHLFMFLEHLSKIIPPSYTTAALAIPEWFDEEDRRILQDLVTASSLNVGCFMTHLTSAACTAFYESFLPKSFVIIDFGHHKTSLGLFSYEDSKLLPKKRFTLKRGGIDFDQAISDLIIERHGFQPSPVIRERILTVIEKIKKGLNTLDESRVMMLDDKFDHVEVGVSRTAFLERVAGVTAEMQAFIDGCFCDPEVAAACECIEVVGNNSNSVIVSKIMENYPFRRRMQKFDLVARGACTGVAVNDRKLKYRMDEICGREVALRVPEEGKQPVVFLRPGDTVGTLVNVRYTRRASFSLEIYDDGKKVGDLHVKIPQESESKDNGQEQHSDKPYTVKVGVAVGKFNTIEIRSVVMFNGDAPDETGTPLEFECSMPGISKEEIQAIVETEKNYEKEEEEYRKLGDLRNTTEMFVYELEAGIDKAFPGLLQDEDRRVIERVMDEYLDTPCGNYEEEVEKKQELLKGLGQITERLKSVEEDIKSKAKGMLARTEPYRGTGRNWTEMQRRFMSIAANLEGFIKNTTITLENLGEFDDSRLEKLQKELESAEAAQKLREAEEAKMAAERAKREAAATKEAAKESEKEGPEDEEKEDQEHVEE